MDKKELRKQIKVLKNQYSLEQKIEMSRPLWEELEQTDFFKEARTVLLYWSMDDEVFTHDYVCKWAGEKTILLPCVKGDVLELRVFKGCLLYTSSSDSSYRSRYRKIVRCRGRG